MVCIKSSARSALITFTPDAPYLAAGIMDSTVDLSFSPTANLEIFHLDLQSDAHDLPLVGVCSSADRFNRLSCGKPPSTDFPLGLIVGGLFDGRIYVNDGSGRYCGSSWDQPLGQATPLFNPSS